jgi:hypothetical protein
VSPDAGPAVALDNQEDFQNDTNRAAGKIEGCTWTVNKTDIYLQTTTLTSHRAKVAFFKKHMQTIM